MRSLDASRNALTSMQANPSPSPSPNPNPNPNPNPRPNPTPTPTPTPYPNPNPKARSIGVSNFTVAHLEALKRTAVVWPPSVNQVECHPLYQQEALRQYCAKESQP